MMFPRYVEREDATLRALYSFVERDWLRNNKHLIPKMFKVGPVDIDRIANPATATHAPPGGGKSHFLQELAHLRPEVLNTMEEESNVALCEEYCRRWIPIMKEKLSNTIGITTSYNHYHNINSFDDDPGRLSWCLLMRALYSFVLFHLFHREFDHLIFELQVLHRSLPKWRKL